MFKRVKQYMALKIILTNCVVLMSVFFMAFTLQWKMISDLSVDKERMSLRSYLLNTLGSLDDRLRDLGRASVIALSDDRTLNILCENQNYDFRQSLEAGEYLQKLFLSMISSRNDISALLLFDTQELVAKYSLYTLSMKSSFSITTDQWFLENLKNAPILPNGARLMSGGPESMLNTPTLRDPFENEYLTVLREIRSFSPYELVGYMMVITRMNTIDELLVKSIEPDAQYFLVDQNGVLLMERNGKHFYQPLAEAYPQLCGFTPGESRTVTINGEKYLALCERSEFSALTLYVMRPEQAVYAQGVSTYLLILAISALAGVLVMVITSVLTRRWVKPITSLADAMASFSRTNTHLSVKTGMQDEAGRLSGAFNNMMDTINDLIFSEYEKNIQLKETQLREKETQLMYLQSQINPHFLYNTLDTIRIKASINGDGEVAALIMKLVAFFRFGIGNIGQQVSIRHEVKLMQVYLELMQCRYPALESEYQLDESLLDTPMPSFVLQPLVENCLTHGLKANAYRGRLTLRVASGARAGDVQIELSDNGIGMSQSLIEYLNSFDGSEEESEEAHAHIGVRNVQLRLRLFYGEGYGLNYARNENGGVTVFILIAGARKSGENDII